MGLALFESHCRWRAAVPHLGVDTPLPGTRTGVGSGDWYRAASGKCVLLLHSLRGEMRAEAFDRTMDEFGRARAGKEVTSERFRAHAEKAAERPLSE